MSNQFYDSNSSPIVIKKSLQKTIAKIEKAITLIEEDYSPQISDLTIVEKLGKNSDILLSYLQDNNFEQYFVDDNDLPRQKYRNRPKGSEKIIEEDQTYSFPKNTPSYNFSDKKKDNRFNWLISIALIISLLFNIYSFFFDRHVISAKNLNNNQEEILPKSLEEEKEDNKTDILENIPAQEDIENTQKQTIIEQDNLPPTKDKFSPEDISPETNILPKNNNTRIITDSDLLTTIINQLEKITDSYQENLIIRIEPNYSNNSISIIVNDNWQDIPLAKRQELTQKIFKKVKSIDLYRFQLKDVHGNLLARNASIGNDLVITDNYYN